MIFFAGLLCSLLLLNGLRLRVRARDLTALPETDEPTHTSHRFLYPEGVELDEETRRAASRYAHAASLDVLDLIPGDCPGVDLLALLEVLDPNGYRESSASAGRTAATAVLVTQERLDQAGEVAASFVEGGARGRVEFAQAVVALKRGAEASASAALAPKLRHSPLEMSERAGVMRALLGERSELAIALQVGVLGFIGLLLWQEPSWGAFTVLCLHAQAYLILRRLPWASEQLQSLVMFRYFMEVNALLGMIIRRGRPRDGGRPWYKQLRFKRDREMKDLSVTAKYTAHCWRFGKFERAELLDTHEAKLLFDMTNAALDLTSRKTTPSLPHSLVQRHAIIDKLLADWLREEGERGQVLELAAGFSARGVRFSANPEVDYTEVDLPAVLGRKRELLARAPQGQEAALRPNLRFIAADLAELDLTTLVDPTRPVFLIGEGLFMYLQAEEQRDLWRRLRAVCAQPRSAFAFDLVPSCEEPPTGRGGGVLNRGLRFMTRGRTFARDDRTREDISEELLAAGFDAVKTHDPAGNLDRWGLPHVRVPTKQLVFHATGGGA